MQVSSAQIDLIMGWFWEIEYCSRNKLSFEAIESTAKKAQEYIKLNIT